MLLVMPIRIRFPLLCIVAFIVFVPEIRLHEIFKLFFILSLHFIITLQIEKTKVLQAFTYCNNLVFFKYFTSGGRKLMELYVWNFLNETHFLVSMYLIILSEKGTGHCYQMSQGVLGIK